MSLPGSKEVTLLQEMHSVESDLSAMKRKKEQKTQRHILISIEVLSVLSKE